MKTTEKTGETVCGVAGIASALRSKTQSIEAEVVAMAKHRKNRQWVDVWLDGLERSGFTGEAKPELHFNQGQITRVKAMREDS